MRQDQARRRQVKFGNALRLVITLPNPGGTVPSADRAAAILHLMAEGLLGGELTVQQLVDRTVYEQKVPTPMPEGRRPFRRDWESFAEHILAADPAEGQQEETKRAFYAGGWSMLCLMRDGAGPDDEPDEVGANFLMSIQDEMLAFQQQVLAGNA